MEPRKLFVCLAFAGDHSKTLYKDGRYKYIGRIGALILESEEDTEKVQASFYSRSPDGSTNRLRLSSAVVRENDGYIAFKTKNSLYSFKKISLEEAREELEKPKYQRPARKRQGAPKPNKTEG